MAMQRYRRRRYSRGVSKRARRSRWVVVVGGPLTVTPGTYVTVDLLTPIQPAGSIADSIYQQMTKPTLIAVMGHMTIGASSAYGIPSNQVARQAEYAWGVYRDVDFSSSNTDLPAYSAGFSNSWMVHKTGTVALPAQYSQVNADGSISEVGIGQNDLQYRRYDLNLRRYKRVLDSFNDTLILSVENGSPAISTATDITFSFYFRMLLLE